MADMAVAREKERTASTSSVGSRPRKGLELGFGKKHAENIEQKVAACGSEEIKATWDKYGDDIKVLNSDSKRGKFVPALGAFEVDIAADASGAAYPKYETTMHESGHNIDYLIAKERNIPGGHYSTSYNNGEFEKTLVQEANDYIKNYQKSLSAAEGRKVPISEARDRLGAQMRREGYNSTGDVSDMLNGATKGKFSGSAGHSKEYWTGIKKYGIEIPGKSVAVEAFAEMFSATTTNPEGLKKIQEVFPASYGVFQQMLKEATT